ncbi:MAG: hypothetical protein AAB388_03450 [Patescibacteria group bacterium]
MSKVPNILQYELFHIGEDHRSESDIVRDITNRLVENVQLQLAGAPTDIFNGLKTCIRVYDQSHYVTHLVGMYIKIQEQAERLFLKCQGAVARKHHLKASVTSWYVGIVQRRMSRLRARIRRYLVEYLKQPNAVLNSCVEYGVHEYRPIHDDELPDIRAIIQNIDGPYGLFVFAPGDLRNPDQTLLAHITL